MATNNQPGKDAFGMPIAYSNTDPNPIITPTPQVPTVPSSAGMSKANIKLPTGQVISASDPNYAEYLRTYPNAIRVPSVIKASSDIVQDTSSIRDGVGEVTNKDANATFDERYAQQTALEAELARIQGLAQGVNKTLDSELLAIENAGKAAGQEFDPLIAKAQEDKRMGEGKAVVGAGRRGGFMRLRDAGEAALGPTEGGTFFGQGGRLEALKSAYDRNIDQLNISKSQAIAAAKAAKETAIRTGKIDDVNLALKLYEAASDANNKAIELNNKKLEMIMKQQESERDQFNTDRKFALDVAQFEDGQSRFDRTQSVQEGWLNRSITEDMKKDAKDNILNLAKSGIPISELTDEDITELEIRAGYEPGSFEAIYNTLAEDAAAGKVIDNLKLQQLELSVKQAQKNYNKPIGGGTKPTALKGFDADLDQAANMIIRAEQAGGGKSDSASYWSTVKQLAEASALSESDVDNMLINEINKKKGITYDSSQQSDVSDFVDGSGEVEPDKTSLYKQAYQKFIDMGKSEDDANYFAQRDLAKLGYNFTPTEVGAMTGSLFERIVNPLINAVTKAKKK